MEQYNYFNKKENNKDMSKGHKIAAAVYLVTNHLSDNDPFKSLIRQHALALITDDESYRQSTALKISNLLETAIIASLISEKNASIIILELKHFTLSATQTTETLTSLFAATSDTLPLKTFITSNMSYKNHHDSDVRKVNVPILNENKSKRQDAILSFIKERKSAGIKDIAALFSDISEKTIQRELGVLVSAGKITKRGEKRWSVYLMA